jgi:hypothetical protein
MIPIDMRAELMRRGLLDEKVMKKMSDGEIEDRLREVFQEEAMLAYCSKVAMFDIPDIAYRSARDRLINRMRVPYVAQQGLNHARIEAELALLRCDRPPVSTGWFREAEDEPVASPLDNMGRWSVPTRRRRGTMKATTLVDIHERELQSQTPGKKEKGKPSTRSSRSLAGGVSNSSRSSTGGRKKKTTQKTAPTPSKRVPGGLFMARGGASGQDLPLHLGVAGVGTEQGIGMPHGPKYQKNPAAAVTFSRMRPRSAPGQRKPGHTKPVRVSATGLHTVAEQDRPTTAPAHGRPQSAHADEILGPSKYSEEGGDSSLVNGLQGAVHSERDFGHESTVQCNRTDLTASDYTSAATEKLDEVRALLAAALGGGSEDQAQHSSLQIALDSLDQIGRQLAVQPSGSAPDNSAYLHSPGQKQPQYRHLTPPVLTSDRGGAPTGVRRNSYTSAQNVDTRIGVHPHGSVACLQLGEVAQPRRLSRRLSLPHAARAGVGHDAAHGSARTMTSRELLLQDSRLQIESLKKELEALRQTLQNDSHKNNSNVKVRQAEERIASKERQVEELLKTRAELESKVFDATTMTRAQGQALDAVTKKMMSELAYSKLFMAQERAEKEQAEQELLASQKSLMATKRQLATTRSYVNQAIERAKSAEVKWQRAEARRHMLHAQCEEHRRAADAAAANAAAQTSTEQTKLRETMAQMQLRGLQHRLELAEAEAAKHGVLANEMEQLRKKLLAAAPEFAPDGTPLGADVPDFEDAPDRLAAESAPDQPKMPSTLGSAGLQTLDDASAELAKARQAIAKSQQPTTRPQSAATRGLTQKLVRRRTSASRLI